ncbi:MAG: 3-deoxy-D-manno-octulosonic acid transferase [Gammaproteobacteria bacterium]|nr:3-deoxy-D-manno-octulosonic acid transferase [Gammaproteobacteria bacterium]
MLRYRLVLALLSPVIWTYLWMRGRNEPAYRQRWRERLGFVSVTPGAELWIHGASLGELVAAKPLIDHYLAGGQSLLITAFTPAGSEFVSRTYGDKVAHCYLPLDWPGAVSRFLNTAKPQRLVVLETELWPNLLNACNQRKIDVRYASARLTEGSVSGYQRFLSVKALQKVLAPIAAIAVQTDADKERFVALGANPNSVVVAGNIKFDLSLPEGFESKLAAVKETVVGRTVLLAASTHAGEEQASLEIYQALKPAMPLLLLVIAPRHKNRFDEVANDLAAQTKLARRSLGENVSPETDVYLADTLGELVQFYAVADVAFVAGSLANIGGHNVLEPALVNTAVVVGPHLHEQPVAQELVTQGAVLQGQDQEQLQQHCQTLLENEAARVALAEKASAFLEANRGALARTIALLN